MLKTLLPLLTVAATLDQRLGILSVQGQETDLSDYLDADEHDDHNVVDDTGKPDVACKLPFGESRDNKLIMTFSDESLRPGTLLTYACEDGLELMGQATRTCGEDGIWSPQDGIFLTFCAGARYHGPYAQVFNLRQCINTWSSSVGAIDDGFEIHRYCAAECDRIPECTAFNIRGKDCRPMGCGSPQPRPMTLLTGWESYSKEAIPEHSTGEVTDEKLKEKIKEHKKWQGPGSCQYADYNGTPC